MSYVPAVEAPERNIGQIKLYDRAEAFAGMAAAGLGVFTLGTGRTAT